MATRTFEIHPALGVARLGSSLDATQDGFFYGPEGVPPPEKYRDPSGGLKRQAARFRVFRCERDDLHRLLGATEITHRDARIAWTVHLANRKGVARRRFSGPGRRTGRPATTRQRVRRGRGSDPLPFQLLYFMEIAY